MIGGYEACLNRRDFLLGALAASGASATIGIPMIAAAQTTHGSQPPSAASAEKAVELATRHHPSNFTRGLGYSGTFPCRSKILANPSSRTTRGWIHNCQHWDIGHTNRIRSGMGSGIERAQDRLSAGI